LTTLLRLLPDNPDLWILAARHSAYEQNDLNAARGYVQRGLRFAPKSRGLWLEHVDLEMSFVQKATTQLESLGVKSLDSIPDQQSFYSDERALQHMSNTPALSGDIVLAVFRAAVAEFDNEASLAEDIFDRIAEYPHLKCTKSLLNHVVDFLQENNPDSPSTITCLFRLPLVGISPTSSNFPAALGKGLLYSESLFSVENSHAPEAAEKVSILLLQLCSRSDVEEDVAQAIQMALDQFLKIIVDNARLEPFVSYLEEIGYHEKTDVESKLRTNVHLLTT
jgi:U3 small nucleolar RNA-associated protein 6